MISMSLGGPFGSGFLERAIGRAVDSGLIVLAAAGNYWPWVVYPARYNEVVGVAAVNCREGTVAVLGTRRGRRCFRSGRIGLARGDREKRT